MLLEPFNMQRYFVNVDDIITVGSVAGTLLSRPHVVVSVLMSTEMAIAHFVSPILLLTHLLNYGAAEEAALEGTILHYSTTTLRPTVTESPCHGMSRKGGIRNSS